MNFDRVFMLISQKLRKMENTTYLIDFVPNEIRIQEFDDTNETVIDQIRYSYGLPLTQNSRPFATGTYLFPKIINLFMVMYNARVLFGENEFPKFATYLFTEGKHQNALLEFRPIISSIPFTAIKNEVPGNKDKTIDWKIEYNDYTILLEVKNRIGNSVRHLTNIFEKPITNPEEFFRSTEEKFMENTNDHILQGIWVDIGIKENKQVLSTYFSDVISHSKMQFFIIAGWDGNECHIETRNPTQKDVLLSKFQLIESDNYVF